MNFPTRKSANRENFSLFVVNLNKSNDFSNKNIVQFLQKKIDNAINNYTFIINCNIINIFLGKEY